MKKILSFLLIIFIIFSFSIIPVSAAENYCTVFEKAVDTIKFFNTVNVGNGHSGFNVNTICEFIKQKLTNQIIETLEPTQVEFKVSADKFEGEAKKHFVIDNEMLTKIRAYVFENSPAYNPADNTYTLPVTGGFGSPSHYKIVGYKSVGGNKYDVYLAYCDYDSPLPPNAVEGEDYFKNTNNGDSIVFSKELWKLEYSGSGEVRYLSYDAIDAKGGANKFPTSGLIRPGDKVSDPTPEPTKPTTTPEKPTEPEQEKPKDEEKPSKDTENKKPVAEKVFVETVGVTVKGDENTFDKDTVVKVMIVNKGEAFETAKSALNKKTEKIIVYDISAVKNNATVQPNGKVATTFPIPESFNPEKTAVIYISDDGKIEVLKSEVKGNEITAYLSHFSTYAVIEIEKEALETINTPPKSNALIIVIIVCVALVLCGGAFCAWYFLLYRKKSV